MTRSLDSLAEVAGDFDAVVLDQWGVLHDGTQPYPDAVVAVERLKAAGVTIAVLSNSGKRAGVNLDRIIGMGFAAELFDLVMTSGEALWLDLQHKRSRLALYPITAADGDATVWAEGLNVTLVDDAPYADAILLMGLPDQADIAPYQQILGQSDLPVYCTNPDRASPRAGGLSVVSPGTLAHAYADQGGDVAFYGKPHLPVFRAVERALGAKPSRILMVGDSLEHDIAGGNGAGWSTAFVESGLHAKRFTGPDRTATVQALAREESAPLPDFHLRSLA